jgi:hypothetical protein
MELGHTCSIHKGNELEFTKISFVTPYYLKITSKGLAALQAICAIGYQNLLSKEENESIKEIYKSMRDDKQYTMPNRLEGAKNITPSLAGPYIDGQVLTEDKYTSIGNKLGIESEENMGDISTALNVCVNYFEMIEGTKKKGKKISHLETKEYCDPLIYTIGSLNILYLEGRYYLLLEEPILNLSLPEDKSDFTPLKTGEFDLYKFLQPQKKKIDGESKRDDSSTQDKMEERKAFFVSIKEYISHNKELDTKYFANRIAPYEEAFIFDYSQNLKLKVERNKCNLCENEGQCYSANNCYACEKCLNELIMNERDFPKETYHSYSGALALYNLLRERDEPLYKLNHEIKKNMKNLT